MNTADKIFATLKSIVKIALQSKVCPKAKKVSKGRIIIMGNGPSLNRTIADNIGTLQRSDTMAVNFAAIAPVFFTIRPRYYVLADPHFFTGDDCEGNLRLLLEALAKVDWPMTLFVPAKMRAHATARYTGRGIDIRTFNAVGAEGFSTFCNFVYRRGLAMPRPRNVLIPAIMLALNEGYAEVDIVGADHSWMKTISVTDDNEVVSVQPHFYADTQSEKNRIRHEYTGYRLHQIVESFAIAFKSYHDIARYAASRGIKVYNATPGSFIDAFPRIATL